MEYLRPDIRETGMARTNFVCSLPNRLGSTTLRSVSSSLLDAQEENILRIFDGCFGSNYAWTV